ncbi:hypothetical protein O6H91_02G043800 [Diphasiastrum complanatum]|uniref:Uncharacterized protein n=1 Tax=Diphasiastrum complanatum TaxID=34168 RepID=A0ACC2EEW1_DIPCM|nr:hypothetical protein O6H91_02G043800 [Diphasiastrum complanatum]
MAALARRIVRKYSSAGLERVRSSAATGSWGLPATAPQAPQNLGYGAHGTGEKLEIAGRNNLNVANLDPEKFVWTIHNMCNILTHTAWRPEKEAALRGLGQLTPAHTVEVLRKRCADPRQALVFFKWLGQQSGYEHDLASYNILVSVLAESKLFSAAQEVYSAILETLMRAARYDEVFAIYQHMSNTGLVPDITNLQSLFNYYHHSEKPEQVYKIFEDLLKAGLIPKAEAQTAFIEGCCRTAKWKEAFNLYEEMVKDGRLPDPPTYLVLVDGLTKAGESDKVTFCAEKYAAIAGPDSVPCLEKVSADKDNLAKLGPLAALGLGVESEASKALKLKTQRFVSDICTILQQSMWGPEKEAALSTLANDIRPIHFIDVLKGGTVEAAEAYEFFKWLKKQPRYKHNLAAYNLMIGVLAAAHMFDPARQVLEDMHRDGFQVKAAMPVVIREYGKAGMVDQAVELFGKLKRFRVDPNNPAYNAVIDAIIRAGRYDKAIAMYEQLCSDGLVADIHNIRNIWEFYHNAGKPEQMYKFFEELCDKALIPWVTGYNVFIDGYSRTGRLEEACAFFDRMLASDCILEVKTYTVLKNSLKAAGDEEKAKFYFDKMLEKGFKPNIL